MSIPFKFRSKEDIITALEARRASARKADKEAMAKHKKEEQEYLKAFREACRAALKWSYQEAQEHAFSAYVEDQDRSWRSKLTAPSCPVPREGRLDQVIEMVRRFPDTQKSFLISDSGQYRRIWQELAADLPEAKAVC